MPVDVLPDPADGHGKDGAPDAPPPRTRWRRLLADGWTVGGGLVVLAFILIAALAPVLASIEGQDPYTYHLQALDGSGAPSGFGGGIGAEHWFGVEPLTGRDLFAIVVSGARTSLTVVGKCIIA